MPEVSYINQQLKFSPIRKLTPFALAATKKGIKIYHLNIGQPDIRSPEIFLKKIKEFDQKTVAYEKSDGNEALKQTLVKYYQNLQINLTSADMVVTQGGSEALQWAFSILFNPGDECLCYEPLYTNYLTFSRLAGVQIKSMVTPRTKGVIITNPNNPDGRVFSAEELEKIIKFCGEKDLFIIADETYREFIYSRIQTRSLLSYPEVSQLVVLTDSLSKRYSLCGARLGTLVSRNLKVMEMANKIAQARLSAAAIEQYAASFLDQVPPSYFANIREEYRQRRDGLVKELGRIPGVSFNQPDGAFYLIAKLPVKDSEAFCRFLLEDFSDKNETVMLAPAADFYLTAGKGKNEVRIAYVLNQKDLKRAVSLIGLGLKAYPEK
jgi:aspartate aminotransferase